MASCKELALNWNSALSTWLPCVIVNLTIGFLRVDHVIRIVSCADLLREDLDKVRTWLFAHLAPFDLFHLCMNKIVETQGEASADLAVLGDEIFRRYMPELRAGIFFETSCLDKLPVALVSDQNDSNDAEIRRFLHKTLKELSDQVSAGLLPDQPALARPVGLETFMTALSSSDKALAFDSETGACFSLDPGSRGSNIVHLFGRGPDVLAATEHAWQTRLESFPVRDNVVAIVDVVAEDGQTRVAFEKTQ